MIIVKKAVKYFTAINVMDFTQGLCYKYSSIQRGIWYSNGELVFFVQ